MKLIQPFSFVIGKPAVFGFTDHLFTAEYCYVLIAGIPVLKDDVPYGLFSFNNMFIQQVQYRSSIGGAYW